MGAGWLTLELRPAQIEAVSHDAISLSFESELDLARLGFTSRPLYSKIQIRAEFFSLIISYILNFSGWKISYTYYR